METAQLNSEYVELKQYIEAIYTTAILLGYKTVDNNEKIYIFRKPYSMAPMITIKCYQSQNLLQKKCNVLEIYNVNCEKQRNKVFNTEHTQKMAELQSILEEL